MKWMKGFRALIIAIIALALIAGGVFLLSSSKPSAVEPLPTVHEYFWGDGCPHCAIVAEFLETWPDKDKIAIEKKEVWSNQMNYLLMQKRAQYCKINKNDLGVPLLFTPEGKCLIGDQPIIDYFKSLKFE